MTQNIIPFEAFVQTLTWGRDSHGLFDYESLNVDRKTMVMKNSNFICRSGNSVHSVLKGTPSKELNEVLALLKLKNNNAFIKSCCQSDMQEEVYNRLWMVLRDIHDNYNCKNNFLMKNDIIQFGRVKYRVKEIEINENSKMPSEEFKEKEINSDIKVCDELPKENDICRFCFLSTHTEENPLIANCICNGTMKFVHLGCLKSWIEVKTVEKESESLSSYYIKNFECGICLTRYTDAFIQNGKRYRLINKPKPDSPYITIQSLVKDKNGYDAIYIISPKSSKNTIKLGRGHEAELRIGDISVSRVHAQIIYENNNFRIEDNKSKFGSLKLFRMSHEIKPSTFQFFQVGRTLIKVLIDVPETILKHIPRKESSNFSEINMIEGKSPIKMNKLEKNKGDDKVEDTEKLE